MEAKNKRLMILLCYAAFAALAIASSGVSYALAPKRGLPWSPPLPKDRRLAARVEHKGLFSTHPFFHHSFLTDRLLVAHAILVRSLPEQESTVQGSPEEVKLWFNEGVGKQYLALAVVNSEGKRVDNKDAKQGFFDKSQLSVTLPPIPAGKYAVRYRVQSADGHIISGKYYFSVALE
ncbi:MAG: copper resistance CopC family protein [Gammaproteobacteria bacterium]